MENFENFPPRSPLKLVPLSLEHLLEVKKTQRQKMSTLWKEEEEHLELSAKKVNNHGKLRLLPVNQITVGQRLVKKELSDQIHSSPDSFQTHQNMTPVQSARGLLSTGQSKGQKVGCSRLGRTRQPGEDQNKSAAGLEDDEGKRAASGATLHQRGMEKVLERRSSGTPGGKVWEGVVGRGSRRMAVYGILEAAL